MTIVHYLDSARLGLMTPTARDRHRDLVEFAGKNAASAEMDRLIFQGGAHWPVDLQAEFPQLASFPGVHQLRDKLKLQLGCEQWQSILFGSSSDSHIRIAALLLFGPCERVLTTDLSWPVYRKVLQDFAKRFGRELVVLPIRKFIENDRPTINDVSLYVANKFVQHGCDGLFLTALSHDGVCFPAASVTESIREKSELFFSVIDGAQEYAQVEHGASVIASDLYLTSSHKWLGGYFPLSLAVYGRQRSASRIEHIVAELLESSSIDDPLLRLAWRAISGIDVASQSTANVAALFSCDGALDDLHSEIQQTGAPPRAIEHSDISFVLSQLENTIWTVKDLPEAYHSRTVLLESRGLSPSIDGTVIRSAFAECGLAVTAYDTGQIRLSIPRDNWTSESQEDVGRRVRQATNLLLQ